MEALATIILPVFALIGIGYAAGWTGLLPQRAVEGLGAYVFNLAIPLLVFRTLAGGDLPDVSPWGYWGAYFFGVAVAWIGTGLVAYFALGASFLRAGIAGCAASYSNTVLLGLPLVLTAFGDEGAIPLFLLLFIHLPVMMTASIVLGETAGRGGAGGMALAGQVARAVILNPIIIGLALGIAWQVSGVAMPELLGAIVNRIADTAVPCALVAMGLTLRQYGIAGDMSLTALIVAMKLVVHPLAVFLAAWALGLPEVLAAVAVLFAAAPSGVNSYLVAQRYDEAVGAVSSALLIGTGLAVFTVTGVLNLVH